jgi:adenine-specific DNA-methyltransferase
MHETIFCFCKDREHFLTHGEVCIRKKLNAEIMVTKAQSLFKKIGKRAIPEEVASAIKPFNYSNKIKDDFYVTYDLALINKEFQNWLSKQKFSGGEKAYKYIDSDGRLYRGVSMAWPNKKTAPENYFIPLIHPVTQKPCPVPERGWRNPPATMAKLINDNLIIFGEDETKQPERKYFLDENMYENVPSIYENADSADGMLSSIGVSFEYPKPVSEATYLCSSIQPQAKVFLDFFAGSGTTGQAVLELNKEDGGHRQFILCTNNENKIAEEVTYPRIKTVITGKRMDGSTYSEGIPANLRYFKTGFVEKNRSTDATRKKLVDRSADMIRIRENAYVELKSETINKYFVSNDAFVAIIFDPFELAEAWAEIEKLNAEKKLVKLYIFSYSRDTSAFTDEIPETSLEWESIPIPESILQVYKRLFGRSK